MSLQDYYKRLNILNSTEGKTILDCIDRPIRPLVIELNRIGLHTRFSCCGFPYRDEEEPKSHSKFPFVVIEPPLRSKNINAAVNAFFTLSHYADQVGWILEQFRMGQWYLNARNICIREDSFYRKDEGQRGIHDYETSLITMQRLALMLSKLPPADDHFTIVDGNAQQYAENTNNEWQIDPKESVTIQNPPIQQEN